MEYLAIVSRFIFGRSSERAKAENECYVRSNTGSSLFVRACTLYRGRKLGIRDPVGWRWGIIARLRSLREEDSMAASTTPGSNYRISPPPPPPPPPSLPPPSLPSSFALLGRYGSFAPYFSPTRVLLFGVCTYWLAKHRRTPRVSSIGTLRAIRPGSEASLTRRLLELSL